MDILEDLHRNLQILAHLLERVITPESLEHSGAANLSKPQYDALLYVQNHPNCRPSELAKAFGISAPTVTTLLQRLERKGLLAKTPANDDQRALTLELTPASEQLLAAVHNHRQSMLSQMVALMPQELQHALDQGLASLLCAAASIRDRSQLCLQCGNAHSPRCVLSRN